MSLSKSRKIMCIILTMFIAAGSILFFGTIITKTTVLSQKYMDYVFSKNNVNTECEKEFKQRIEILEAKSGIPARVFDAVYKTNDISNSSAITRLYNLDEPDLYTDNQIEQFESLCKEYLEGNNMQYDKELIHNTAVEATKAYSDCFGLQNSDALTDFIGKVNNNYLHFISIGVLLMAVPAMLMLILFRRSREILFNIFAAFTISGMSFTISAIASLIVKVGQNLSISPQIYSYAFGNAAKGACVVSIVFGVLLTAASVFANVKITKSLDSDTLK